jgi:Ca-activated chloride channel family protein
MNQLLSHFAHPEVFWLLPLLALVGLAALWSWRQKRRAIRQLGQAGAVHKLLRTRPASRRLRGLCLALGLLLLLVGSAGPKWGWDLPRNTAGGHDVVIVLDASNSMKAEQPSRWERSLRALYDLADHLEKHGGPRLALVVFAAQPQLVFPLTRDYDHFRTALGDLEAGDFPAHIFPDGKGDDDADPAKSGTRIGAALTLAVQAFDDPVDDKPRAHRAVLLLSDGDDPEPQEQEWMAGVQAARAAHVPIHTVGIGDPTRESVIIIKEVKNPGVDRTRERVEEGPLQFEGKDVKTKLEEAVLQDIAQRTGGEYLPARTSVFPLGSVLPDLLAQQKPDPSDGGRGSVPVQQPRQAWFLWSALVLLSATLLFREKRGRVGRQNNRTAKNQRNGNSKMMARLSPRGAGGPPASSSEPPVPRPWLLFALIALFQLAAFPSDDDWLRQGNAAFADGDLEKALSLYEKAEPDTTDPGRVAFNKAAVLYRLKRYREAELHYLRCLEDRQAPPARQAQALFHLGAALVRQAEDKDVAMLDRAIDAFSTCLTQRELDPQLATDAQFNLETARWLRFKATPPPTPNDKEDHNPQKKTKKVNKPPVGKDGPDENGSPSRNGQQDNNAGKKDDPKSTPTLADKLANSGGLQVLPDTAEVLNLAPEDTARRLDELVDRIRRERRRQDDQHRSTASGTTKNW